MSNPRLPAIAMAVLVAVSLAACGTAGPAAPALSPGASAAAPDASAAPARVEPSPSAIPPDTSPSTAASSSAASSPPSQASGPLPSTGIDGDLGSIDSLTHSLDGALGDDASTASQGDTNP